MTTCIAEIRDYMDDQPQYADEKFTGDGQTATFLCTQLPINDSPYVSVTVGGVAMPICTQRSLITPNNVYLDYNTGRVIFGAAPAVGSQNVIVHKDKVQRRDSTIARSLMAGLRALWPSLWQTYVDTTVQMLTNIWDYQLPPLFSQYPDIKIFNMEIQAVPSGVPEPYRIKVNFRRVGEDQIHIEDSQFFPPGSTLRVTYAGPYTDITQLEGRAANLPNLYALAMLLGTKEIRRANFDRQTTAAGESANPPGASQNAGSYFYKMFYTELQALTRVIPTNPPKSTYRS
jgi:hypothetical protein